MVAEGRGGNFGVDQVNAGLLEVCFVAPLGSAGVGQESLGQLGPVNWRNAFTRDDRDMAVVAVGPESLDSCDRTSAAMFWLALQHLRGFWCHSPANNQHAVLLLRRASRADLASLRLDMLLLARDVHTTVLLHDLELVQWVKCRRILDVAGAGIEASYVRQPDYRGGGS